MGFDDDDRGGPGGPGACGPGPGGPGGADDPGDGMPPGGPGGPGGGLGSGTGGGGGGRPPASSGGAGSSSSSSSSSSGGLCGRLFVKHAFEFLALQCGDSKASSTSFAFSLGPFHEAARNPSTLFADKLVAHTDPGEDPGCSFVMMPEDAAYDEPAKKPTCDDDPVDVAFFTVIDEAAARLHVPHLAPHLAEGNSLIISRASVAQFRSVDKVLLHLDCKDGTAEGDVYVLSASTLSLAELCTMRRWRCEDQLQYVCDHVEAPDQVSKDCMHQVLM